MILADGMRGRMHRSAVLGPISEIPTRNLALTLLERRLGPLNQGLQRPQSMMRLRKYVEDEWKNLLLPTLKLSTQRGYRMVIARHLLPYFGDWRMFDITKLDIQQFVSEKFRQGLAWQTVRNVWTVLSSILNSAVEYGYLTVNPARGVKFPPQAPAKQPEILTAEAFAKLLKHLREPCKTMVAVAALTGLRVGELLALRWRAVDLASKTLRVEESVYEGKFQKPKSEKSTRTIPLGPQTCWLLKIHRRRSVRTQPEDLVFPNQRGGPQNAHNLLNRELRPAAEGAGIGRVGWHQLRHIHASVLHDIGVPAKVVQQQLGHATVETTLKVYTHAIPETHRRAVEDLERVLFPNVPKLAGAQKVPVC
ncbi:MAG TPA: site-specific integrase [Candidatus Xenobia bacterium]|nr:site-specific integrase [Candidatus Xenobia bacterium]